MTPPSMVITAALTLSIWARCRKVSATSSGGDFHAEKVAGHVFLRRHAARAGALSDHLIGHQARCESDRH